jgi:hypothetical protein
MELKDFVAQTLVQIVEGIDQANDSLSNKSAFVVSSNIKTSEDIKYSFDKERIPHYVSNVDFDVAINIQDSQSKTGGANIEVFSVLNIGGKGEKGLIDTSTNRIKFTLPLALPTEPEDKHFTTRLTPPKRPELK